MFSRMGQNQRACRYCINGVALKFEARSRLGLAKAAPRVRGRPIRVLVKPPSCPQTPPAARRIGPNASSGKVIANPHMACRPMCQSFQPGMTAMSSSSSKRNANSAPTHPRRANIQHHIHRALRRRGAHHLLAIQRTQHNLAPPLEGPGNRGPQARRLVPMQSAPAS